MPWRAGRWPDEDSRMRVYDPVRHLIDAYADRTTIQVAYLQATGKECNNKQVRDGREDALRVQALVRQYEEMAASLVYSYPIRGAAVIEYKEYPQERIPLMLAIAMVIGNSAIPIMPEAFWLNRGFTIRAWDDCA